MRKIYSFMVGAVAMFAAVSCTQELKQDNQLPEGEVVVFEATVDGADTKAILDETVSKWSGEELITILDGVKPFTFYTNATEPSTTAKFTYEGNDFNAIEVMAVYPSGEYSADIENKTVSGITIPDYQILVDGTYPATAAIAAAYSNNRTLSFCNATTLLKFKVSDENITKGAFYADAGKGDLTGSFTLDYNNGEPILNSVDAKQWVDFGLENGAALSTEATYYVAVAPATFATGFGISLNGIEIKKKVLESEYKFARNFIYDLGTLSLPEASLNWSVTGTFNEWGDDDMTLEGEWFVAKGLTITKDDRFKFRADHDWAQNRGASATVDADKEYEVVQNGDDIYVNVSAIYDVYLSKDLRKMKVVKVGDYVAPKPEEPETPSGETPNLYLKPNANWKIDNARFAVYTWDGGDQWFDMKDTDKDGIYEVFIPSTISNIIFCRMNPNTTANNWNNKWNQSSDLKMQTNGNNLYTVKENTWDKGGGTWSKK